MPGCGDFCFVWSGTQTKLDTLLKGLDIAAIEGPIERSGALVVKLSPTGTAKPVRTWIGSLSN